MLYRTTPEAATARDRFDVIIVLGSPTNWDRTVSPDQRERTLEAVREYRRGVAPRLFFTGGAAHNSIVEAITMGSFAMAQGVPRPAVFEEGYAIDTEQNAINSLRMMKSEGWRSAEVIACPSQARRAGLIFSRRARPLDIDVRIHSSPWPPEFGWLRRVGEYAWEVPRTDLCRVGFCGHEKLLRLLQRL